MSDSGPVVPGRRNLFRLGGNSDVDEVIALLDVAARRHARAGRAVTAHLLHDLADGLVADDAGERQLRRSSDG